MAPVAPNENIDDPVEAPVVDEPNMIGELLPKLGVGLKAGAEEPKREPPEVEDGAAVDPGAIEGAEEPNWKGTACVTVVEVCVLA